MAIDIKAAMGYDTEERVKLEAGIKLNIVKFALIPSKKGNWVVSHIDSKDINGNINHYYSTGTGISGILKSLQESGYVVSEENPVECDVVSRKSVITGFDYLALE